MARISTKKTRGKQFLNYIQSCTIENPQPSTSTTGAPPREDNSDASLPSLNNSYASLNNSYASLDDIPYDNTIVLLDDAYDADSSIDITTITEADRDDAAGDVITPPAKPKSPSSRSLTQSPIPLSPSETAAVGDAEAAPIADAATNSDTDTVTNSDAVTHFRPVRICRSRNWEGRYADDCSSDELQESSQESFSVVDKTEDSD